MESDPPVQWEDGWQLQEEEEAADDDDFELLQPSIASDVAATSDVDDNTGPFVLTAHCPPADVARFGPLHSPEHPLSDPLAAAIELLTRGPPIRTELKMAEVNFGGSDEENAEMRKLNAEVVRLVHEKTS